MLLRADGVSNHGNRLIHSELAGFDRYNLRVSEQAEGDHDLVDDISFFNRAENRSGRDPVTGRACWCEFQCLGFPQRRHGAAALEKETVALGQFVQGILQTVVHGTEQPRAQRDGEHLGKQLHPVTCLHTARIFKDLKVGRVAEYTQNLRLQSLLANTDVGNLVLHDRAGRSFDGDDIARHTNDRRFSE